MEDPPLVRCGPGEGPRCVPPAQASILAPAPTLLFPKKRKKEKKSTYSTTKALLRCTLPALCTAQHLALQHSGHCREVWVEICVATLICVAHSVVVVSNIDTGLCLLDDGTVFY